MSRTKPEADYAWVADHLARLKTTQPDGSVAFAVFGEGYSYDDLLTILETYHSFDNMISYEDRRRIIHQAVSETARKGDITAKSLKAQILKFSNLFMIEPESDFVVVTSLSISCPQTLKRLNFNDARMTFSPSLPSTFSRDRIDGFRQWNFPNDLPAGYTTVRIKVKARSGFEAFQKAIDSIDCLRGMWNFQLNRRYSSRYYSGRLKPLNAIRLGPVHTLHKPNGEPAATMFWYESLYPVEAKPEILKDWPSVKEEEKQIRRRIQSCRYSQFLNNIFIRYARSLDSSDHDSDFLKLWSLLEFITVITNIENYDEVIKRSVFLSYNEDFDRRILEHLRIRRNASVHRGEASNRAEGLIVQLKQYVERLIIFHLRMSNRYSSQEEVGQLLAKTRDVSALRLAIARLNTDLSMTKAALRLHDPASKNTMIQSDIPP